MVTDRVAGRPASPRHSVLLISGASICTQGSTLLLFVALSHRLSADHLGAYRLVLIAQALAAVLAACGMETAMLYRIGRATGEAERRATYRSTLAWLIGATLVCAAGSGALVAAAGHLFSRPTLTSAVPFAALAGGFGIQGIFAGPFFIARGMLRTYLAFAVVQTLALVTVVLCSTRRDPGLETVLLATASVACAAWTALVFLVFRASRRAEKGWQAGIPGSIRYGAPIALSSTLYALSYQMDHFIASRLLSVSTYALYAAGAWQIPVGPLVQRAQADAMIPRLSAHHASGRQDAFWADWRAMLSPWTVAGVLLFWAVFPVANDLVTLALGVRFSGSAAVLQVYSLMLPLRMTAFATPLRAAGITHVDLLASVVFGVVNLVVGAALTPRVGLVGPAVGVTVGYAAWVGVNLVSTRYIMKTPMGAIFSLRRLGVMLALGGAAAGGSWIATRALPSPLSRLAGYYALYGLIAGGCIQVARRRQLPAAV